MLHIDRWKRWLIALTLVLGGLAILPNLLTESQRKALPGFLPSRTLALGLDLQGGAHFLVEVKTEAVYRERMERLVADLRRGDSSLRSAGVKRYSGLRVVDDTTAELRVTDAAEIPLAIEAIRKLAQPISSGLLGPSGVDLTIAEVGDQVLRVTLTEEARRAIDSRTLDHSLEIIRRRVDELGTREPTIQREGTRRILIQLPGADNVDPGIFGKTAKLTFHLVNLQVSEADIAAGRVGDELMVLPSQEEGGPRYAVERRALVTGDQLEDAQQAYDPRTGAPVVNFRFDLSGAKAFARATTDNVGKPFAIVLDGKVVSAPRINEPITGGSGQISGNFTVQSANELAILLRAGALPAPISIEEASVVGPELGADSVAAGKIAGYVALGLVIAYMVLSYGLFGVFSSISLLVNVVLLLGALSLLGATLTLPGIAGIVLTIGMAVDANVLIFERIREELRSGKGVARSINAGYDMALSAIIDANVTTLISTVILFSLGSGPIKGFAVTLTIGVLTSMFTAIYVTRWMTTIWHNRTRPKTLNL